MTVDQPLYVLAILAANVVLAERLAKVPLLRPLGAALLVIITTAICANTGVIPPYSAGVPIYDGIFAYAAPLGIFWLLLQVDLRQVFRAGRTMLSLFLIGALGVAVGAIVGMKVVGERAAFGDAAAGLAAMFTGTYIGGSINFNAMAIESGVDQNAVLYAGANAVDAAMTTVWMIVTLLVPRLMLRGGTARSGATAAARATANRPVDDSAQAAKPVADPAADAAVDAGVDALQRETIRLIDLAWLLLLGAGALWISKIVAEHTPVPATLVSSTLALVIGHIPAVRRISGGGVLGIFAIMLFLAVIGALCDLAQVTELGETGKSLVLMVTVIFAVHGAITFGAARLMGLDPVAAAVASQANVGGGTNALALARSLGRPDLELPAVLVGSLGTALGNYAGLAVYAFFG